MATSENLSTIESWAFRPNLSDTWFTEYIARESKTITKAFHNSISPNDAVSVSPFLNLVNHDVSTATAPTTSTVSGISGGTDQESAPKRRAIGATGKVTKRKSRASKRSHTVFITAEPANFRQMVQQVTGVRFRSSEMVTMVPVLKPEPQRVTGGVVVGGHCLPTLDTSAFLLDHQQQQVVGPNSAGTGPGFCGVGPLSFGSPIGMVDGSFGTSDLDFDTFSNFPTLESWKVM
ncbi:hypothetical protein TanjilG_00322 [Lupinus angustifolius]|uniref:VQ domain-containing protein n=1 Tax=Lupinus angustifolius TaxID=3871 RepID=A0A1J7HQW1_LUPAN|nr:PREDICTED: calmodulin-binding protein 25-like [Lupinus angustifolius]OIW15192.1 hypothetical protein TanjilG_00322 [Lupinus angustifolius]